MEGDPRFVVGNSGFFFFDELGFRIMGTRFGPYIPVSRTPLSNETHEERFSKSHVNEQTRISKSILIYYS